MKSGTVIHGTLRPEDLIPAFADELASFDGVDDQLLEEARNLAEDDFETDLANEIVNALIDALNEIEPHNYLVFGAHEGDGSDFGWWPNLYSLEEDAANEDGVIKVNDTSDIPAGWQGYVMLVSDHGNVTLLAPKIVYEEVWGVV